MTQTMNWTRESFDLAVAKRVRGASFVTGRKPVGGYVLRVNGVAVLGLGRSEWPPRDWQLTHVPTGALITGGFAKLADGKRFAEELAAEANCAIGRFGKRLAGVRGVRAFAAAVNRRRELYGFNPVQAVNVPGVEYGPAEGTR